MIKTMLAICIVGTILWYWHGWIARSDEHALEQMRWERCEDLGPGWIPVGDACARGSWRAGRRD